MRITSPRLARAFSRSSAFPEDGAFLAPKDLPASIVTAFGRACAVCALALGAFLLLTGFIARPQAGSILLAAGAAILLGPRRGAPRLIAVWLVLWALASVAVYMAVARTTPTWEAAAWLACAASLTLASLCAPPAYSQLLALLPLYVGAKGVLGASGAQMTLGQAEAALGMLLAGLAALCVQPGWLVQIAFRLRRRAAFAAHGGDRADAQKVFERGAKELDELIRRTNALVVCRRLPLVSCDEVALKLVFQCLIARAIAARGSDPPHIKVTSHAHSEGWLFIVEDNGIGIAAAAYRPLPDPRPALSRCKQLVEQFGGTFWMQSSTGNGSTFCFILPAAREVPCNTPARTP